MMDKRTLQTQFSVKATDLAQSFRSTVGRFRVGPYAYAPDMTAPEGPSTGGGVQSLQHIRLLPPQANMPTLVVGHANQRDRQAELRTFEHVDAICRERFKQGAPLDPGQYEGFLQSAQDFLAACGMRVALVGPPADLSSLRRSRPDPAESIAPPKRNTGLVFALAVAVSLVVVLGGALVWLLAFKK
jgi:hypothetical protein